MEDGVKEDPAKPKEVKVTGKAGWLKKSSGKFLASYKDRYIHLDKTEIVVYDNEDLKNCIERVDLENFDKCHELRSPFKKKNRLVLIGATKSGSKVSHVKLQAQNQEEKDAWIKALSDGINRAKNKIFDEVKVDEGLSLEHVTRSRPKGNRGRRPPTRIHMKEVANVSSEGIVRLDLDAVNGTPNGTHILTPEKSETPKPDTIQEENEADAEDSAPPKKVVKPPMPPSKENKSSESEESETPQKKVLMPPMPPSKDKKPPEEEEPGEVMQEKKVIKPPMPPSKENKPAISANEDAAQENASDSGVESEAAPTPSVSSPTPDEADNKEPCEPASESTTQPPAPPSKDKKPSLTKKESLSEDEDKDKKDEVDTKEDSQKTAEEEDVVKAEGTAVVLVNTVPKPQGVSWDSSSTPLEDSSVEGAKKSAASDTTESKASEPVKPATELKLTPHSTPEPAKKVPPAPPKKKPLKPPVKTEDSGQQSAPTSSLPPTVTSSVSENESAPQSDTKPDTQETKGELKVATSPSRCSGASEDDISGAEVEVEVEEKSIDSGQISAEDSESGDQGTPSEDKLQGSLQGLDGETSEEDLESCDSKAPSVEEPSPAIITVTPKAAVEISAPTSPAAQLSSKKKAASLGDLIELQDEPKGSDMKVLQSKVSIELEETGKLLEELGPDHEGESNPEILLATAMEKLRQADQFLKEAKCFKELENKSNRTSW